MEKIEKSNAINTAAATYLACGLVNGVPIQLLLAHGKANGILSNASYNVKPRKQADKVCK